ncbi:MAG: UTP--glucose-1-phosphate uridylyltransferase [Spirochaetales bacterium]|nr:UTP--glucose-1-phosphate uridylyltransferase [Spirochaetales bacterium]
MKAQKIDIDLTLDILDKYNNGEYKNQKPIKVKHIPKVDGVKIINMVRDIRFSVDYGRACNLVQKLNIPYDLSTIGEVRGNKISFDRHGLYELGLFLLPVTSYGILNGGSASSYIDNKKNRTFNTQLFELYKNEFKKLAKLCKGKAKGITPAFLQPNGKPGPSFLELKMRAVLIKALEYELTAHKKSPLLLPVFQMTSVLNNTQIRHAYNKYRNSPFLKDLIQETGIRIFNMETGVQPLIAAYTSSKQGDQKQVFARAFGKHQHALPMPGGHGQNFFVLKNVYENLYNSGIRYAYLGNVDNLGFTPDPLSLALFALSEKPAAFEFSFKTPVDVKGGILIVDQYNRFNTAEIGPAISWQEIRKAERSGRKVLFNCAVGLFNLEYLVKNLDSIIDHLPVRFSDQEKDAGSYSQAEQITWEILGLLEDVLIFAVDKFDRFLAVKMLIEGLMTSGLKLDHKDFPTADNPAEDFKLIARRLHEGLKNKLTTVYGLTLYNNKWMPKSVAEIKAEIIGSPF